jgi:hypothetical protein
MHFTDKHLEGCMQIATTEIEPNIQRFTEAKAVSDSSLITDFVKENY